MLIDVIKPNVNGLIKSISYVYASNDNHIAILQVINDINCL